MSWPEFFASHPLYWLPICFVATIFAIARFLRKGGWLCYLAGAVGLVALIIVSLLHGAGYLDVGLMALIALLPLMIGLMIPSRRTNLEAEP